MKLTSLVDNIKNIGSQEYNLHFQEWVIVGLRGTSYNQSTQEVSRNENQIDFFNDLVILIQDGQLSKPFVATMDPGWHWIKNPMQPGGAAQLVPGLYTYTRGKHRGHDAFVQGAKVNIARDTNLNGVWEPGEPIQSGYFGINIHASYAKGRVGKSSAGCTVIDATWNEPGWTLFRDLLYKSPQKKFCYLVLNDVQIEKCLGR